MLRTPRFALLIVALVIAIGNWNGCSTGSRESGDAKPMPGEQSNVGVRSTASTAAPSTASRPDAKEVEHGHKAGSHGGIIVSLGRDSYHVEAIVTGNGELRLYTLGNDETRIQEIEIQDLVAYIRPDGATDSSSIEIKAHPQPGDAKNKASLFLGQLPKESFGKSVDVTIPNITISGERFRLGFTTKTEQHPGELMPAKVSDGDERELYLAPGGLYTQADIEANGKMTASQKFVGFQATHDLKPKVGDKICPVTLTKANPKCTWIVGGKSYEFCCPPCVDEFVTLAKAKPEEVKAPEQYVKGEANTETK